MSRALLRQLRFGQRDEEKRGQQRTASPRRVRRPAFARSGTARSRAPPQVQPGHGYARAAAVRRGAASESPAAARVPTTRPAWRRSANRSRLDQMSKQRVLPRVRDIPVGKRNAAAGAETAQPVRHRGTFAGRQRVRALRRRASASARRSPRPRDRSRRPPAVPSRRNRSPATRAARCSAAAARSRSRRISSSARKSLMAKTEAAPCRCRAQTPSSERSPARAGCSADKQARDRSVMVLPAPARTLRSTRPPKASNPTR